MMHHQSLGGPGPTELELELADIEALQKIKEAYKWDDQHKEYQKRLKALQKKWQLKKGNMPSEKQAMKEKFLWAEWGKKDAGDFKEAVSFLPEIFGAGKYGTSGVHSRGGKQNYKDEWCAWKRFARDGRHFRVPLAGSSSTPLATSTRRASCPPRERAHFLSFLGTFPIGYVS